MRGVRASLDQYLRPKDPSVLSSRQARQRRDVTMFTLHLMSVVGKSEEGSICHPRKSDKPHYESSSRQARLRCSSPRNCRRISCEVSQAIGVGEAVAVGEKRFASAGRMAANGTIRSRMSFLGYGQWQGWMVMGVDGQP